MPFSKLQTSSIHLTNNSKQSRFRNVSSSFIIFGQNFDSISFPPRFKATTNISHEQSVFHSPLRQQAAALNRCSLPNHLSIQFSLEQMIALKTRSNRVGAKHHGRLLCLEICSKVRAGSSELSSYLYERGIRTRLFDVQAFCRLSTRFRRANGLETTSRSKERRRRRSSNDD